MILQVITPQNETYDFKVSFPKDYLGKQVHCLFYTEEEAKKNIPFDLISKKKPSDFFGILNKEEGEKFHSHITNIRGEWERNS